MLDWNNAPREILTPIFQYLSQKSKKDILQCILVCKKWKNIAEYYTLKEIYILKRKQYYLILRWLESYEKGHIVEKITLDYTAKNSYLLDMVSKKCKNITQITGRAFLSAEYWKRFGEYRFQNLKILPNISESLTEPYYSCAIRYKDTLTTLEVISGNNDTNLLFSSILDFTQLQFLKIHSKYSTTFKQNQNKLVEICPLKLLGAADANSRYIEPHPLVKSLMYEGVVCNDVFCYINRKFPNLSSVYVKILYMDFERAAKLQKYFYFFQSLSSFELHISGACRNFDYDIKFSPIEKSIVRQENDTSLIHCQLILDYYSSDEFFSYNNTVSMNDIWNVVGNTKYLQFIDKRLIGKKGDILQDITSIKNHMVSLEYISNEQISTYYAEKRHDTLRHLHLEAPSIASNVYKFISVQLINLSSLSIKTTILKVLVMNMPNIQLNSLRLKLETKRTNSKINIKSDTKIWKLFPDDELLLCIKCKSIKSIVLKINNEPILLV